MVSAIVAVRNGDSHLERILDQLCSQEYPESKLEIIVIDDGLTNSSRVMVNELAERDQRLRLVDSISGDQQLAYKKRALDAGIRQSKGELLLFTDVDCQVGPHWVSTMVSYFMPGVDYVIGWSQVAPQAGLRLGDEFPDADNPVTLFEQLDFLMLMLAARGATLMGTPLASTGQNQAYRRAVYDRAGGFEALASRLQGDDSLFLQVSRKRARARAVFATHPDSWVVSDPASSLEELLFQRTRWAGDAVAMWRFNPAFLPIPVATFGSNALIIVLALAAIVESGVVLPVLIPGILLKALLEGIFLWRGAKISSAGHLRRHFPLWFLLQIPYITIIGLASFWGNRLPWRRRSATKMTEND
ncbi:MAG: glycosyltransferase [Fidelibacterota bacterium]|nr:MAG: glycosyltransferase [Candidatus Neomarinimicrobiota bacterium]